MASHRISLIAMASNPKMPKENLTLAETSADVHQTLAALDSLLLQCQVAPIWGSRSFQRSGLLEDTATLQRRLPCLRARRQGIEQVLGFRQYFVGGFRHVPENFLTGHFSKKHDVSQNSLGSL